MLYHLGIPWGIYRVVYIGLFQRCLQFISHFTTYLLSTGQYLDGTLGVFTNLVSLGILLKCLEDTSEEAYGADGVYAVLQNQNQNLLPLRGLFLFPPPPPFFFGGGGVLCSLLLF